MDHLAWQVRADLGPTSLGGAVVNAFEECDAEDHEDLKKAMSVLAKAMLRVLRLVGPGKAYTGRFQEFATARDDLPGLHIIGAGNRLILRAGRIEFELSPKATEAEEAALLESLAARTEHRKRLRDES